VCEVTGNRYRISGHKLPLLRDWFTTLMNVGEERLSLSQPEMTADKIPKPIVNDAFVHRLRHTTSIDTSDDPQDRLFRAHGHTMDELFMLRYGQFERIPDLVVWPSNNKIPFQLNLFS
jgi:alkyldihydroxyacetonephosphate synthase